MLKFWLCHHALFRHLVSSLVTIQATRTDRSTVVPTQMEAICSGV